MDVLDRLDLLRQDRRQRGDADRSGRELLDDRGEQLAVGRIEALVVDLHAAQRVARGRLVHVPSPWTSAWSRTRFEQSIDDARRPPAASGDLRGRGRIDPHVEDVRRAVDDRGQLRGRVEVEAEVAPKRSRNGELMRPARVVAPTT